jgi:hypothetical protein
VYFTCKSRMSAGDQVQVFCKYCPWHPHSKYMVASSLAGAAAQFPRIARSDGWVDATVIESSETSPYGVIGDTTTGPWVRVKYTDKLWVDRTGHILSENSLTQWLPAGPTVRPYNASYRPKVSVLAVRWGGQVSIDEGRFDFALGDKLIQELMDTLHNTYDRDIEVHTVHVSHSLDLNRVSEFWAQAAMSGTHKIGMYFLWGANDDAKPGYVQASLLHDLMERMETVGIVTKYPNSSTVYRMLTSKEYQPLLCSNPDLAIPATIMYPSSKFISSPSIACTHSLEILAKVRGEPVTAAVAKVGYEWMGDGVRTFGEQNMQSRIQPLLDGAHGRPPVLLIQERIDSVLCEPRAFVFNGRVENIRYTWNTKEDRVTGRVHALRTCHHSRAAQEKFGGDVKAQKYVERQIHALVAKWNQWLLSVAGEVPIFVRIDFLVEDLGKTDTSLLQASTETIEEEWDLGADDSPDGTTTPDLSSPPDDSIYAARYKVWTCELGEIGSSMVGYKEGKDLLFQRIAKSCCPQVGRPSRPPPVLE